LRVQPAKAVLNSNAPHFFALVASLEQDLICKENPHLDHPMVGSESLGNPMEIQSYQPSPLETEVWRGLQGSCIISPSQTMRALLKTNIPQNSYTHLPSSLIPTLQKMGLMYEPNQHWIADIKTNKFLVDIHDIFSPTNGATRGDSHSNQHGANDHRKGPTLECQLGGFICPRANWDQDTLCMYKCKLYII